LRLTLRLVRPPPLPTRAPLLPALLQAEFEKVLHPIFEEDELTLVLVGGVLGLVVGYLQAAFTQPERDPNDDSAGGGDQDQPGSPDAGPQ
jgi:hypothetical protein